MSRADREDATDSSVSLCVCVYREDATDSRRLVVGTPDPGCASVSVCVCVYREDAAEPRRLAVALPVVRSAPDVSLPRGDDQANPPSRGALSALLSLRNRSSGKRLPDLSSIARSELWALLAGAMSASEAADSRRPF